MDGAHVNSFLADVSGEAQQSCLSSGVAAFCTQSGPALVALVFGNALPEAQAGVTGPGASDSRRELSEALTS